MENMIKNTVVGLVLAGGLSAANAHIPSVTNTAKQAPVMLLEYMNTLDKDAAAREAHAKDPQTAMGNFGLTAEEQVAVMSGDKKKIAMLTGVNETRFTSIQLNITTY
jgi:hypothetical protein